MSQAPHSQKLYYREKMRAKWESERIKQRQELSSKTYIKPYSIAQDLCVFLDDAMDKEYCLMLDPYIDVHYKKDREIAVYLKVKDDSVLMSDIIRFIHMIIVGRFFIQSPFVKKPLSVIILREIDKLKAYQRVFEVICPPHEWGETRRGFSILRTESLFKTGVVDILVQPLNAQAKGLNADNFTYQLSILSNGKPYSLSIAQEIIKGRIFVASAEKIEAQDERLKVDGIEMGSFFAGIGILALLVLW